MKRDIFLLIISTAIVEYPSEEFEEYRHMIYECDWPEKILEME